jgi:cyanophycinase-like exopeptidase
MGASAPLNAYHEDTAVLIDREGVLEVLGSEIITIVDGRNTRSDSFEREIGKVLTIANSSRHVLAAGRRCDLNTRQLITDESEETHTERPGACPIGVLAQSLELLTKRVMEGR